MLQAIPDDKLSQTVLDFLTKGAYPESEDVAAAKFPASAAPVALEHISKAREEAENEICELSRQYAPSVDGWITQARNLHKDIERSRLTAREIVAQHEKGKSLRQEVTDATAKLEGLRAEIEFNQEFTEALESVRDFNTRIDTAKDGLQGGEISPIIDNLEGIEAAIGSSKLPMNSYVAGILSTKATELRRSIANHVQDYWSSLVRVDRKAHELVIVSGSPNPLSQLEETISALDRLKLLDGAVASLEKDLYTSIIGPVLHPGDDENANVVLVEEESIRLSLHQPGKPDILKTFDGLTSILTYVQQRLPVSITRPLSAKIVPTISSALISSWLSSSIPINLGEVDMFQTILNRVSSFSQTIDGFGWPGTTELKSWVNQIPRLWLTKRRVNSLDEVRKALVASSGNTKEVERVEKEKVSSKDEVFAENTAADEWGAWGSDEENPTPDTAAGASDEEDVSAWGFDDDADEKEPGANEGQEPTDDIDDAADAWGWGDEDDDETENKDAPKPAAKEPSKHVNGDSASSSNQREVTLKELYTVTDIPDSIASVILRQVSDSKDLSGSEHAKLLGSSSSMGLLALPTLILAMFKATAPSFYSLKLSSGQMFLYNDCMYLAEQLRGLSKEHDLPRLQNDVDSVEKFGKLAYSKEMQSQRTILTDILDGAQGFTRCSQQPYLGECETAVHSTVDRIRAVHKEWEPILSHSALVQSIGSLLSTAVNKIIIDIEDLSDISEPESQRLATFCGEITKLEDLFIPTSESGAETSTPLTAVYVRNWLKFQYLVNILESSLADIKYMWKEGELQLEFSSEEVIDLIVALFADSEHRKSAINDVRRNSRGH